MNSPPHPSSLTSPTSKDPSPAASSPDTPPTTSKPRSEEQKAKKRAADRIAQRRRRERTQHRIQELEGAIQDLLNEPPERRFIEALRQNRVLRAENERLRWELASAQADGAGRRPSSAPPSLLEVPLVEWEPAGGVLLPQQQQGEGMPMPSPGEIEYAHVRAEAFPGLPDELLSAQQRRPAPHPHQHPHPQHPPLVPVPSYPPHPAHTHSMPALEWNGVALTYPPSSTGMALPPYAAPFDAAAPPGDAWSQPSESSWSYDGGGGGQYMVPSPGVPQGGGGGHAWGSMSSGESSYFYGPGPGQGKS